MELTELNINVYDYKEFSSHKKIGDGGFGSVFKSEWTNAGLTVALKSLEIGTEKRALMRELQFLQRVAFHPKINHFYGITEDTSGSYNIVLQFANDGNLRDYLDRNHLKLQWDDRFRIAKEIAQGLVFLHDNNIVHRDLHPRNILVHENKMIIADFGLSKLMTSNISSPSNSSSKQDGIPAFMDPQVFKIVDPPYRCTTKSDVYSYGVILWEISSGRKPFSLLKRVQIAIQIYNGEREKPIEGTPPEYVNLYVQCWDDDPSKRPDMKDVYDSLNQLIYKPTDYQVDMKKPLSRLLERAFLEQSLNYYEYNTFSDHIKIESGFSSVYKAKCKSLEATVCLKCIRVDEYSDELIVEEFIEKLLFLQNTDFHSIIKFYGLTKDPSSQYYSMVFQCVDGGNLRDYLMENFSKLQWSEKLKFAIEIAEGLKYLHKNKIAHCGLVRIFINESYLISYFYLIIH
ncbi:kinase-like protein [Gigaspora margarita]|uniref:Kinase-like protein n=1 Tax=Gigaspora margarita TaxID=4874 RepID=A0A8H3XGQ2_GIGMA|nr:kinase-like protein [Gigaspora margarita]